MNRHSKKLPTMAIIFLVLPFVTLMTLQLKDVAAESPTVTITDVTSTSTYKIDVTVEITLIGFNYDFYTEILRLYLNQSVETIIANSYTTYNATKTLGRQTTATFSTNILSPILTDGSHTDSAYYNVTVVTITNTGVKSDVVQWSHYIFIDTKLPVITFIHPNTALEEIWGIYPVTVKVLDESNLSKVYFYIDNVLKHEISNPPPEQTIFVWNWISSSATKGQHTIKIKAIDDTPAQNSEEIALTIKVVGPSLIYRVPIPTSIDMNDSLVLNTTISDATYNITSITLHYAFDGVWDNITESVNILAYNYTYTFPPQPIGTNISWEIIANNSAGQYHVFKNPNLLPYSVVSVHWDHIDPVATVDYEKQVTINDQILITLNVTEQSLINTCLLHYRINEKSWQQTNLNLTSSAVFPGLNQTWYYYEYNFTEPYPIFTQITFYIWLNDSGNNYIHLDNKGKNYIIKIIPHDLVAPNVTLISFPDRLIGKFNVTITVEINETSGLSAVTLFYSINNRPYSVNMTHVSNSTWTGSFILIANIGDKVKIWVQAIDEYYNTGISEIIQYDVETAKQGIKHNNFVLFLVFLVLLVAPIVITLLILKPQK